MAKNSGKYEIVYIIDPAKGEEGIAALVEKFKAMVEAEGTLTGIEEWGKRRLAYPHQRSARRLLRADELRMQARAPRGAGSCVQDHRRHSAFHHRRCRSVRRLVHAEPYCSHGPSHP